MINQMTYIKGFTKPVLHYHNPVFYVPAGDDTPNKINMIVEIPKGSFNKYEYNPLTGFLKLDRVLYEQLPYPIEYGLIPQTWNSEDNDMLDIACLVTYPTTPGCIISVRPIGALMMNDSGEKDTKILAVPDNDIRFSRIDNIKDLDQHKVDEIAFFFQHYKELQFKYGVYNGKTPRVIAKEWCNAKDAKKIISRSVLEFQEKFPEEFKQISEES